MQATGVVDYFYALADGSIRGGDGNDVSTVVAGAGDSTRTAVVGETDGDHDMTDVIAGDGSVPTGGDGVARAFVSNPDNSQELPSYRSGKASWQGKTNMLLSFSKDDRGEWMRVASAMYARGDGADGTAGGPAAAMPESKRRKIAKVGIECR